jgi:hypothetical protein
MGERLIPSQFAANKFVATRLWYLTRPDNLDHWLLSMATCELCQKILKVSVVLTS